MKRYIGLTLLFLFTVMSTNSFAEVITVGSGNAQPGQSVSLNIEVDDPSQIAGAAFTLKYDKNYLTLNSFTSTFFDTFANQWSGPPPVPNPSAPTSVEIGGLIYTQPLVENPVSGGTSISAARCMAGATNTTLFTASFIIANNAPPGNYPVTILKTTIANTAAGYSESGEDVPVLVGAIVDGQTALTDAFPEIPATLISGEITVIGPTVATPMFLPVPGTYTSAQSVTLSCSTSGASIHYTTDNSEPTVISDTYSLPINVSSTTTIKAKAFKSGWTASATAIGVYNIHDPKKITASAGPGGKISPSGTVTVDYGSSKAFTITPATGYSVSGVLVDGTAITTIPATGGAYTFNNVTAKHTISASFKQNNTVMRHLSGIWSDGVRTWNQATNQWTQTPSSSNAVMLASGKVDNDNEEDLIGVWPSGLYVRQSTTGQWIRLSKTLPIWITTGDLNDDGLDDIIGSWPDDGVCYRDSSNGKWFNISSPTRQLSVGNIGGYNRDDLLGIWDSGLWVRYSATSRWQKIDPTIPICITAGDMTGSGRSDIIGSYANGTCYWNSETAVWTKIASSAEQLTADDIDGDGRDDLIGIWSDGVWVRYSATGQSQHIASSKPLWIFTTGITEAVQAAGSLDDPLKSGYEKDIIDLSKKGPGSANITSLKEKGPDTEQ